MARKGVIKKENSLFELGQMSLTASFALNIKYKNILTCMFKKCM